MDYHNRCPGCMENKGSPKVCPHCDLNTGAARQVIGEQVRSLAKIIKPDYSSEEQYHIKGKQIPWADIYAVSASLYCTITGATPPESLSCLSEDTLKASSQLGVKLDPLFEKALLKAMAVMAKDGYQTMEEFHNKLVGLPTASQAQAHAVAKAMTGPRLKKSEVGPG